MGTALQLAKSFAHKKCESLLEDAKEKRKRDGPIGERITRANEEVEKELRYAAKEGDDEKLKKLIDKDETLNLDAQDKVGGSG